MGVVEMVEKILEEFPVAIQDEDAEKKNVVLLAIENKRSHVYCHLLRNKNIPADEFRHVDYLGNSALHLAAAHCEEYYPWTFSGSGLQMQWDIKWLKFVKYSRPPHFFAEYNYKHETPREVFHATHTDFVNDASKWLSKTCESSSIIAVLVATVAYATASTVPGGVKAESGEPTLKDKPPFIAFAVSSLVALCSSITALVVFLSIIMSQRRYEDLISPNMPRKLLLAFTSLSTSLIAMLVSFFGGHTFVLKDELRDVTYCLYAALCVPLTCYAFSQMTLYFDLLTIIFGTFRE